MTRRRTVTAALLLLAAAPPQAAAASSPVEYCRAVGNDDTLRPVPGSLVPAVARLFQLHAMPAAELRRTSYFRCARHRVWVCVVGANLHCGKADTRRTLPGADAWCAEHPGSDFIPASATGHDTIYRWRCDGPRAAADGPALTLDPNGFIAEFWKSVDE